MNTRLGQVIGLTIAHLVPMGMVCAGGDPMPEDMKHQSNFMRGIPVVTSTYVGERSDFDAFDLLVNIPSSNQDMRLLRQQQKLEDVYASQRIALPHGAMVDLSGRIEVQSDFRTNFNSDKKFDARLDNAELDVAIRASQTGVGFISLAYDNDSDAVTRSKGSRLKVKQAYFTFGNFNQYPFYATLGQYTVPFGRHDSAMLTSSFTSKLGSMHKQAVSLGYRCPGDQGVHAVVFAHKGDLRYKSSKEFGGYLDYHFDRNGFSGYIGGGLVSNLAEADAFIEPGDQLTINPGTKKADAFEGFARKNLHDGKRTLTKRVMGANLHGELSYQDYTLIAEAVSATGRFDEKDLQHKEKGARPMALNVEGHYQFKAYGKPVIAALGYGLTRDALALGLPEHRFASSLTTAMWPSTLQAIEVSYHKNYAAGTKAAYRDGTAGPKNVVSRGKSDLAVTLHFGYYF